jgi:hypothetical protein
MRIDRDINKEEILAGFVHEKFRFTESASLIVNLSYGIDIQLSRETPLTFDSIEHVTIRRIWPTKGIPPQYPQSRKVKPLGSDHFSPKTIAYNRDNNKGNSLALLVILALKTAYDEVRKAERPGLLFLSEIFKLRELGLWKKKNRELDGLVSRLRSYWKHKDKKVRKTRTNEEKDSHRYKRYPLVDEFLIDAQEIYNIVCWKGINKNRYKEQLIAEKVWVLNAHPSQVRVFMPEDIQLRGESLRKTLSAFFPDQILITPQEIAEYENIIKKNGIPFFQSSRPVAMTTGRDQLLQDILETWKTLENYKNQKPPEIVSFDDVFAKYPVADFVGRKEIKDRLDAFGRQLSAKSRYFLIVGEAGIGKTALICNYLATQREIPIHYFIKWRRDELDSPTRFLKHLYFALSYEHKLETEVTGEDPGILFEILKRRIREVSDTILASGKKEIIFVDGLDEAKTKTLAGSTIIDLIKFDFPHNFAFVIFSRDMPELEPFKKTGKANVIYLSGSNKTNLRDLRNYFSTRLPRRIINRVVISMLVRKSGGNFLLASFLIDMIKTRKFSLARVLHGVPEGLDGYYEFEIRSIEEKVRDSIRIADIRRVMRMISILEEPHTPKEICDYLNIDYMDVNNVFGALEQFFDLSLYHKHGECRWFHVSFRDFVLNPVRFPEAEGKKLHSAIADYTRKAIDNGTLHSIPKYSLRFFTTHYRKATDYESMLKYVRLRFIPAVLNLEDFPLENCEDITFLWMPATNIGSPEDMLVYGFLGLAFPPLTAEQLATGPTDSELLRRINASPEALNDPVSFAAAIVDAFVDGSARNLVDIYWLLVRLLAVLQDKLTSYKAAYEVAIDLIRQLPETKQSN